MNPSDSIGLTDFLVLIFKFFKRNVLLIGGLTILGLIIGVAYAYQKPNYYNSELVGFSDIIDQTALLEILAPLTTLTKEKNYEELSLKLNIPLEQAQHIRALEFKTSRHTKTSHAPQNTDKKLGGLIVVKATVYDQSLLNDLETGIQKFLGDNPYLQESKNLEVQKTNNLILEINNNLNMVDSLYRSTNQNVSTAMVSIRGEANPINYYNALLNLENLKVKAKLIESFTIVSSFYVVSKPANNSILIVSASTIAFLVLSLLIVFLKELQKLASK